MYFFSILSYSALEEAIKPRGKEEMKKSHAGSAAAVAAVFLAIASIPTGAIAAQTTNLDSDQSDSVKSHLASVGVDGATQDLLVTKMNSGTPWDSMTTAKPVRIESKIDGSFAVEIRHFADGSVSKSGTEIPRQATASELAAMIQAAKPFVPVGTSTSPGSPQRGVTPMATGVRLCTYGNSAGVYYASNCQVYYDGISWSSSFRANYQRWSGGSAAQYVNGSRNTVAFTLTVSDEQIFSLEGATRIRYAMNLHPAGWGNIPFKLDLKVTSSQAYAQLP
jgi:hypothetical protein